MTLERCNIGDEILAILLDPDPLRLNPPPPIIDASGKKSIIKSKKTKLSKSFSVISEVEVEDEEIEF